MAVMVSENTKEELNPYRQLPPPPIQLFPGDYIGAFLPPSPPLLETIQLIVPKGNECTF